MSLFRLSLLVTLIILIILLLVTYTTNYIKIPNFFNNINDNEILSHSYSDIKNEKPKQKNVENKNIDNYLIDTNFTPFDSDDLDRELYGDGNSNINDYQMTETTGKAIAEALKDVIDR
jgi:hypothetical protein